MGFESIKTVDVEKLTEKVAFEDSLTEVRGLSINIWGRNALFRMNKCSILETKSILVSVRHEKGMIVW